MAIVRGKTLDLRKKRAEAYAAARKLMVEMLDAPTPKTDWRKVIAECPQCEHTGPVDPDFGLRTPASGVQKAQSWCKTCRGEPKSHPTRNGLRPAKRAPSNRAGRR